MGKLARRIATGILTATISSTVYAQDMYVTYVANRMKEHERKLNIAFDDVPNFQRNEDVLNRQINWSYCPADNTIHEGSDMNIDTIDHEIAHHYVNTVSRRLGLGRFPMKHNCLGYRSFSHELVAEGIATYIELKINNKETPEHIDRLNDTYRWAYRLVKPALDENFDKGIEYFLRHYPTQDDLMKVSSGLPGQRAAEAVRHIK